MTWYQIGLVILLAPALALLVAILGIYAVLLFGNKDNLK